MELPWESRKRGFAGGPGRGEEGWEREGMGAGRGLLRVTVTTPDRPEPQR